MILIYRIKQKNQVKKTRLSRDKTRKVKVVNKQQEASDFLH